MSEIQKVQAMLTMPFSQEKRPAKLSKSDDDKQTVRDALAMLQTFKKEADYYDIGLTEKEETTLAKFAALVERKAGR